MKLYVDHVIQPSGQETAANTLSFAVILINQHPEVLNRYLLIICVCVHTHICMVCACI